MVADHLHAIECPTCHAPPGSSCRTYTGAKSTTVHVARQRLIHARQPMTVHELRRLLDDLPGDVPILLNGRVVDEGGALQQRWQTITEVRLDPDDRDRVILTTGPL